MEHKEKLNLKVGIVGCGNIAKVHLRYVTKYLAKESIALCDKDELRLEDFSKKVGVGNIYNDLEKMINEFHPDIIHILTPPATHKEIALNCLEKGAHVLIEKPICISLGGADEIIKMAQKKSRLVCVDHMRLFDPQVLKTKEILNSGRHGKIVNISCGYSYDFLKRVNTDAASRWINNLPGGAFFDIIPHPLSLLEEFLPDLRVKKSFYCKNKDNAVTDLWCIFSSSCGTGTLHMSLNIFPLKNYVVFECTKGILKVDFRNFLITIRQYYGFPNAVERVVENISVGIQMLKGTFGSVFNFFRGKLDPYSGLDFIMKQFYNEIINNGKSPVTPEKAKKLLEITENIFSKEEEKEEGVKEIPQKQLREADILVTGGTGFIGHRLVNRLIGKGYKVRVLTHRNLGDEELKSLFSNRVEIIHGDIYNYRDAEVACKGINTVYHLAAATRGDWNYHLDTTITGTKNILNAAAKMDVKHLVYVSTLNVCNAKQYPPNGLINEDFPYEDIPEKRGAYSHAKLIAEKIVREYADRTNMSISILRPGLVYGPGRKVLLQDVGYRFGKKAVIVLGSGRRRLPLVYVDNLVEALLLVGESREKAKGVFNIVDNDYPTQREFIKIYKKLSGERFFTIYIPIWITCLGFLVIERLICIVLKKSPSFRYKLKCVSKSVRHSTERIEKILGWKPRIIFEEGLKLTIQGNI